MTWCATPRRGVVAIALVGLALAWAVTLAVAGCVMLGGGALVEVSLPAVVVAYAALDLHERCRGESDGRGAWVGVALLWALATVAILSVGLFVLPLVALLALAAALTPAG